MAKEISTLDMSAVVRAVLRCGMLAEQANKKFYVVRSGPIYDALKHVQSKFTPDVYVQFGPRGWVYCDAFCSLDFTDVVVNQRILTKAMDEAYKNGYGIYFIAA